MKPAWYEKQGPAREVLVFSTTVLGTVDCAQKLRGGLENRCLSADHPVRERCERCAEYSWATNSVRQRRSRHAKRESETRAASERPAGAESWLATLLPVDCSAAAAVCSTNLVNL